MRQQALIFTILTLISCNNRQQTMDIEISEKLEETINKYNNGLWKSIEQEFYNRIDALGLFEDKTDSLIAFRNLIEFVKNEGYPEEFYLENDTSINLKFIHDLREVGFVEEDESAQNFLHGICKPIVDKFNYSKKDDIIYAFGIYHPDSITISYDITAANTSNFWIRSNLRRPSVYKVTLLFYFSRMIRKDRGKNLHC